MYCRGAGSGNRTAEPTWNQDSTDTTRQLGRENGVRRDQGTRHVGGGSAGRDERRNGICFENCETTFRYSKKCIHVNRAPTREANTHTHTLKPAPTPPCSLHSQAHKHTDPTTPQQHNTTTFCNRGRHSAEVKKKLCSPARVGFIGGQRQRTKMTQVELGQSSIGLSRNRPK